MNRRHLLGITLAANKPMAVRVPVVRPRDQRLELPTVTRDWRLIVAVTCFAVVGAAALIALVLNVSK